MTTKHGALRDLFERRATEIQSTRKTITTKENALPTTSTECKNCHGVGEIDPDDGRVDLDSTASILAELAWIATDGSEFGIRGSDRNDRINCAARIGFLAARFSWLETSRQIQENLAAKGLLATADRDGAGDGRPGA